MTKSTFFKRKLLLTQVKVKKFFYSADFVRRHFFNCIKSMQNEIPFARWIKKDNFENNKFSLQPVLLAIIIKYWKVYEILQNLLRPTFITFFSSSLEWTFLAEFPIKSCQLLQNPWYLDISSYSFMNCMAKTLGSWVVLNHKHYGRTIKHSFNFSQCHSACPIC